MTATPGWNPRPRPALSAGPSARIGPGRLLRADRHAPLADHAARLAVGLLALAVLGALWGASGRDLGPSEAAVGLASEGSIAPFGQVAGSWSSSLLPGAYLPAWVWAWIVGESTPSTVHMPATLAMIGIGLILARRAAMVLGVRAGGLAALAWLGSLAAFERPLGLGFDPIVGLGVIGALDQAIARRTGWIAGAWASWAVLAGGWPALAAVLVPVVVLGRRGAYVSVPLLIPPLLSFGAWSSWALLTAPAMLWGEAIAGPLRAPNAWMLAPTVLAFGLPWVPMAGLLGWPSARAALGVPGRLLVLGWLQASGALLIAGSLIPGMASATFAAVLGGLAIASAAGLDRALDRGASAGVRRTLLGLSLGVALGWAAIALPMGAYLAAAVPYFRPAAIVVVALAIVASAFAVVGAWESRRTWPLAILVMVAIGMKVAHAAIYVPEWNYRVGQGPWGRAIGQWVPPRWPVYSTQPMPPDLAFALGRPVRRLIAPVLLRFEVEDAGHPAYVLLHPREFEHWPERAPALIEVRRFEDAFGSERVLARTGGDLEPDDDED